ncbi:MAG: hypothetical protein E6J91_38005 [Deltaproteobacteria bacterium]|nr:MAG: hypothetical protein E6J91_38005 [Deltaproteobacteria bacterium]
MSTALSRQVGGVSLATQSQYVIRRKFWSIFERVFRVFTGDGQLIMYIQHPLLKLREEFLVYADEARARPLLRVVSRQVVALNFCYDVADAQTGALLGTVQKRGLRSLVRDTFVILDPLGIEIGCAQEQGAALLRRLLPLLPSRHAIFVGGEQVAEIRQRFRLFTKEFAVTTRRREDAR